MKEVEEGRGRAEADLGPSIPSHPLPSPPHSTYSQPRLAYDTPSGLRRRRGCESAEKGEESVEKRKRK
jgi:hypothetical protein